MIALHLRRIDAVLAPDLDRRALGLQSPQAVDHEPFEIRWLQVDEGRVLVALLGQEVELEHLAVVMKHLPKVPDDALFQYRRTTAIPVRDLEAALCETDRTRAHADAFVVIKHQDRDTLLSQIKRRRNTDRATADHHDRVTHGLRPVLIGTRA